MNFTWNVVVFLGLGNTSTNATSNATIITTTGSSIPLLPGTDEILTFVPNACQRNSIPASAFVCR